MTSNRNALAINPDYARTGGPFDRIELEDGSTTTRITAQDTGILPRPGESLAAHGSRVGQALFDHAEDAALTAEMDALPVATYVIVTAVDGLPLDGGEDVDGGLQEARTALHEAARAMDEHTETAAEAVAVLAAMTLARTARVGTVLTMPGGVTLTLALRRA